MFNSATKHFCKQLKIRLPIIQAPMAGNIVSPELVAEVAKCGGLGSLSLGYLSLLHAQNLIQKTVMQTSQSFAVNVFIPPHEPPSFPKQIGKMLTHINLYRQKVGLSALTSIPTETEPSIDEVIGMIIDMDISVLSFTFGILSESLMNQLHQKGIFVMGTATTVQEGCALAAIGCDAVIAQGYEAGGHRGGGFLTGQTGGLIGTLALVPQMVDAVTIPVIAAGGIMDGRGIAAALALGASAVQMGTAFLSCIESSASFMHKQMILDNEPESTCITSAFTGKPARGFNNDFVMSTEQGFHSEGIPAYPLQHQLTQELRRTANQLNQADCAGLWSGQGTRLSRTVSVQQLITQLEQEIISTLQLFRM